MVAVFIIMPVTEHNKAVKKQWTKSIYQHKWYKYTIVRDLFIQQHLLSAYCVPGSIIGTWESLVNKEPASLDLTSQM